MKTLRTGIGILLALHGYGMTAHAEDIDLYSTRSVFSKPNVLIVLDNAADWNASLGGNCTYTDGSNPSLDSGTSGAMEQCALVNVVNALPLDSNGLGLVNLGLMTFGTGSNQGGQLRYAITPMTPQNKSAFSTIIKNFRKQDDTSNGSQVGASMQEAWAYYTGHTGISGRDYSSIKPTPACQNNFIIYIANTGTQASVGDAGSADVRGALANAGATAAQLTQINVGAGHDDDNWADEWTRFMRSTDISAALDDNQSIITYTIAVSDPAHTDDNYVKFARSMAIQGGGKTFTAASYSEIVQAILKILNEIQSVNSVFSSSSLPVSVNAQGTYLNQIFMGMFRPDPEASPRWMGNLKQYQFKLINNELVLGDSTTSQVSAINPSTGFISPNAISFWTSKDTSSEPDRSGGFWRNDPQGLDTNNQPNSYDSPDGEVVEKGGVSQRTRLANLHDDYQANPTGPRKLYTYCPGGSNCNGTLSDSSNAFATSNNRITDNMLSSMPPIGVSSITRPLNAPDTTATVVTASNHGFSTGASVTISGANQSEYNGTFIVTRVNDTTFTYTVPVNPPTTATGTDYTASIPSNPLAVTALSRGYGVPYYTATATVPGHHFSAGQTITISNAASSEYNNSFTVTAVSGDNVSFIVGKESPNYQGGGGMATIGGTDYSIATSGIQRGSPAAGSAGTRVIVTVTSNLKKVSTGNIVTITGASPTRYNGSFNIINTGAACSVVNTNADLSTTTTPGSVNGSNPRSFCFDLPASSLAPAMTGGTGPSTIADSTPLVPVTLARSGTTATATVKSGTHPFAAGQVVNIGGTPGAGENNYVGSFTVGSVSVDRTSFTYTVNTSPATPATGTIKAAASGTVDRASLINWVRGEDNFGDEASPAPTTINIRPSVHGDVLHSRPVVINYGGSTGIVVYYGANDGVFRAVNGNQTANIGAVPAGGELWGFIPTEFFGKLARLRSNSPSLLFPTTPGGITPAPRKKDYFVDGPTGVYQKLNSDGSTAAAYIYLAMRRGDRLLYALDVTSPTNPSVLWKKDISSLDPELGYTWSQPKVALVRGYGNGTRPVLIFGAGYDTAEDTEPPGTDTMGRGIFILDAISGDLVWSAKPALGTTSCSSGAPFGCLVAGMTYSIAADIALMDRDRDGKIERLYAADVGGNIWRVDLETTDGNTPDRWRVSKLAALGCDTGPCASGTAPRKFLYPPDVVPVGVAGTTGSYDAVLLSSGDREHPLYSPAANSAYNVRNKFFMIKDTSTSQASAPRSTVTLADLTDVTSRDYDGSRSGYYFSFSYGEQGVNAPVTSAGYTYFGTNQSNTTSANMCAANLGAARTYQVKTLTGNHAYTLFTGGGLPPSPVVGLVNIVVNGEERQVPFGIGIGTPGCTSADCTSALGGVRPPINVSTKRHRTYWYNK